MFFALPPNESKKNLSDLAENYGIVDIDNKVAQNVINVLSVSVGQIRANLQDLFRGGITCGRSGDFEVMA